MTVTLTACRTPGRASEGVRVSPNCLHKFGVLIVKASSQPPTSDMHQSHNIAWDSLTTNLTFISENPAITPRRTDLFPRGLSSQANSLNHFARTIATTIRTFSDTERAKYPAHYEAPLQGKLFPDDILSRYCDLPFASVTPKSQLIENWIERAGSNPPSYGTGQGDLADVVKVLLAENQLDRLLMLAQHPQVPLHELHWLSWGHSFGWDHTMQWALEAYIFFNVLLSKPELHVDGRYKSMSSYQSVVRKLTYSTDYDAQTFPHRDFFFGALDHTGPVDKAADPLADPNKLQEYLKMCFRLLYRYDMLAQECGVVRLDWEGNVAFTVGCLWKAKTDYVETGKDSWVTRFA
ncbi:hypothetical protein MVEN_01921500 [Mycena venus]|uniref:Uncharacterized protein n=1 Tax=Mycena venus TaxID=2733690 RepID=A0A8H6XEP5_9AGAR|nr:hypothetical protein MVEN_01921500 [Mycena venus]